MATDGFRQMLEGMDQTDRYYKALSEKYAKNFKKEFKKLIKDYCKLSEKKFEQVKTSITDLLIRNERELWDAYDMSVSAQSYNWLPQEKTEHFPYHTSYDILKEEWRRKREYIMVIKGDDYNEADEFYAFMNARYWRITDGGFRKLVYAKLKEVFTGVYFNEILRLDSEYLRYFDSKVAITASIFVDDINEFISNELQ